MKKRHEGFGHLERSKPPVGGQLRSPWFTYRTGMIFQVFALNQIQRARFATKKYDRDENKMCFVESPASIRDNLQQCVRVKKYLKAKNTF